MLRGYPYPPASQAASMLPSVLLIADLNINLVRLFLVNFNCAVYEFKFISHGGHGKHLCLAGADLGGNTARDCLERGRDSPDVGAHYSLFRCFNHCAVSAEGYA